MRQLQQNVTRKVVSESIWRKTPWNPMKSEVETQVQLLSWYLSVPDCKLQSFPTNCEQHNLEINSCTWLRQYLKLNIYQIEKTQVVKPLRRKWGWYCYFNLQAIHHVVHIILLAAPWKLKLRRLQAQNHERKCILWFKH